MSRRKVTMLEAFQASAKDAAERAATERRRLIAEREKEIRREEAARTAGELRGRMSAPRGVSGRPIGDEPENAAWTAPAPLDVAIAPAVKDALSDAPGAEPLDAKPASELTAIGRALDPDALEEASALEETLFTLPMSARTFIVLQTLLLASVFFVGWTVGGAGGSASGDSPTTASAGGRTAGPGAGPAINSLGNRSGVGQKPASSKPTPGSPTPSASSPTTPNAAPPATQDAATVDDDYTAADQAFQDPGMKYTILAHTRSNTAENADEAWDAYDHLRAEGLPVVRPIQRSGRIYVYVGAAPELAQLKSMVRRLHELRSPTGGHAFRSAYLVNIERTR